MTAFSALVKRNSKLFFKDKGMFVTSLITPLILLVLYASFLADVYKDSFALTIPKGVQVSDKLLNALVGGQLISSLLAVCCITIAFCSNMLMVQDKANGTVKDLTITPVKKSVMAVSYYVSTSITTFIISLVTLGIGFIYLNSVGWYLSVKDVMLLLLDVFLLVMFGTALSSVINFFLSTQGQISAVGTVISAGYGFICGAYMPISQLNETMQKIISFLPGTYGTSLLRNHCLRGALAEMGQQAVPSQVISEIKNTVDYNLYFFETEVTVLTKFAVIGISTLILLAVYILLLRRKKI